MIRTIEAFTPKLLTSIFQKAFGDPNLLVKTVSPVRLSFKTAYNAQLYRLELDYSDPDSSHPKSVIAKLADEASELSENSRVFQPGPKEEWFYRCIAPAGSISAPRFYFGDVSRETGLAALLIEDLGRLEASSQVDGMTRDDAELALTEIARFHARWWNKTATSTFAELRSLMGTASFAIALVDKFFEEAWPLFLKNSTFSVPTAVKKFGDGLIGRGESIEMLCRSSPQTLLHGDYRVDNMLFAGGGDTRRCFALDWEDVGIGCGMSDIAWLIAGCMPNISAQVEHEMLRHYHECLQANGVSGYAFEECFEDYRRCMVERFIQGVLSGTVHEPETASEGNILFATAIGSRFVAAADRLSLQKLML